MSLSRKVIKSGAWLQVANFLQMGVNFIITTILARLLIPGDFGLIGIVTVYTGFITIFTTVGLGPAIIQNQDIKPQQISTLYWLNFVLGFLSTVVVAGTAGFAARFYGYPELVPLIRLASLNFSISPFFQIHRRLMEKNLQFPTIAKIYMFANVISGIVGIAYAYLGFGVYSLVFQSLALNASQFLAYRFSFHWQPQYAFAVKDVKEMIYFSIKMRGAMLSRYLEKNIDLFILGKLLPSQIFGYYALANRIIYFPIRRISYTFTDILFPSFSKIQTELARIKDIYLKTIQIIAIFVFPVLLILGLYARPLVFFVLGEQWLPVSRIVLILSMVGAIQSVEQISQAVYPAIDRAGVSLKLGIIRTVLTGIGAFIGSLYGLIGAAVAILIAKILLFFISMFILKKYIKFTFHEVLNYLKGPLLGVIGMVIVFFTFINHLKQSLFNLSIGIAVTALFYCLFILLTNFKDLKYLFLRIFQKV